MDNETITNNAPGDAGGFDVSAAFFGTPAKEQEPEGGEGGAEPSPAEPEDAADDSADDGGQDEGNPGEGEGQEVWQLDGQEFTADQVSEALKHRQTFERFNQSITPLIDNIKAFGEVAQRIKVIGITETENQITELNRALASGRLNAQEYQEAHQMLTKALGRKETLEAAAKQEEARRQEALKQAHTHNARLVATELVKKGWSKENISQVQQLAQQNMKPEQFQEALSVGFMEILRDAFELRAQKEAAAAKLRGKAQKVLKVGGKPAQAAPAKVKKSKAGDSEWMAKNFWGAK
ncbi:hypothetical protein ACSLOU_00530 [Enterobacter cloacae]|uniref:hypothetical protein n=1 Tax=Enterobacter cloacae TaxID=550 RepID=UPI003EE13C1F